LAHCALIHPRDATASRQTTGLIITMNFLRRTLLPVAAATLLAGIAVAQTPPRPAPVPRPVVPEAPVPPPPEVDGKSCV
jgi:D-alanyl-D-alanine carboxypeptidase (penicillin-binding protein 5/6)